MPARPIHTGIHRWAPSKHGDFAYCTVCDFLEGTTEGHMCSGIRGQLGRPTQDLPDQLPPRGDKETTSVEARGSLDRDPVSVSSAGRSVERAAGALLTGQWARDLCDACHDSGTAYFLKQLGGRGNKRGGDQAVLDGRRWTEMPKHTDTTGCPA